MGYNSIFYAERNYDIKVIVKDIAEVIKNLDKNKGD